MSSDPDQIRDHVEATRSDLSASVKALGESVRPGHVSRRQVDKVKSGHREVRERVMVTVGDLGAGASDSLDTVRSTAGSVRFTAKAKTRGNPLAAGLVAFGTGWLVASLLPASAAEQNAATALTDKARPLIDAAQQTAQEVASHLQGPTQQAVQEVTATAVGAASTVKQEAQASARQVADSSKQAVQEARDERGNG